MKIVFGDGIFALLNHFLTGARHPVDVCLAPTGTKWRPTRFRSDLFRTITIILFYFNIVVPKIQPLIVRKQVQILRERLSNDPGTEAVRIIICIGIRRKFHRKAYILRCKADHITLFPDLYRFFKEYGLRSSYIKIPKRL